MTISTTLDGAAVTALNTVVPATIVCSLHERTTQSVVVTVPANFEARPVGDVWGSMVATLGIVGDTPIAYEIRQTAKLAQGSSPSVAAHIVYGDLQAVADATAPTQVTGLTAIVSGANINTAWSASTDSYGVTGYKVERATNAGFTTGLTTLVASTALLAYTDTTPVVTTPYWYRVTAFDAAGNYATPSAAATATVPDSAAPGQVTGLTATAGDTTAALAWTAPTDNVGVILYDIEGAAASDFVGAVATTSATNSKSVTGLTNSVIRYFRVRARDAAGNIGTWSATASCTPAVGNTAPNAFVPTVSAPTATGATVTFATTDPEANPLTYKVAITASATPPADWSGYTTRTSPYASTGLASLAAFYAHVQASDGTLTRVGTSAQFTTLASGVIYDLNFAAMANGASIAPLQTSGNASLASVVAGELKVITAVAAETSIVYDPTPLNMAVSERISVKARVASNTGSLYLLKLWRGSSVPAAGVSTTIDLNNSVGAKSDAPTLSSAVWSSTDILHFTFLSNTSDAWAAIDTVSNQTTVAGTFYTWIFEHTPTQFRIIFADATGTPIRTSPWKNLSEIYPATGANWYWWMGDQYTDGYFGDMRVLSIKREVI